MIKLYLHLIWTYLAKGPHHKILKNYSISHIHTIVILMFHWFLGLWLDQELPGEANLLLVVCSHLEELAHVVELSLHVCVE